MTNNETGMRVGVFDSGLGGLSVLVKALDILPDEKFLYYADTDHVPYGDKTKEQIIKYVDEAASYMIDAGCKALVIACNTATSVGVDFLRDKYDFIPIIGIEPAVKPAVLNYSGGKRVLVVATPVTINGKKLDKLIKEFDPEGIIDKLALPGLVNFAENGIFDPKYVIPYLQEEFKDLDLGNYGVLVLGCTHFPFFKDSFKSLMPGAKIIDGAKGSSNYLKTRMGEEGLLAHVKCECDEENPRVVFVESGRRVSDKAEIDRLEGLLQRLRDLD
ncbi:MAG: glutamate racemase [Clostridiales bacterium]|nr:glutamate racemase [Clostridiales bacterium]MBS5878311.1 glutamate racemase [Clostridiales bacterium]